MRKMVQAKNQLDVIVHYVDALDMAEKHIETDEDFDLCKKIESNIEDAIKKVNKIGLPFNLAGYFPELDDEDEEEPEKDVLEVPKVGRNEPCPCGSGKKFKKCCRK